MPKSAYVVCIKVEILPPPSKPRQLSERVDSGPAARIIPEKVTRLFSATYANNLFGRKDAFSGRAFTNTQGKQDKRELHGESNN